MLGRLEVVDGDRRVALPRGHARALLAVLALRAGEVVSSERLIDQLWGATPPQTAVKALHGLVSILRQRLEPDRDRGAAAEVVQTWPPGYVLSLDRDQVDVHRFRGLVHQAQAAPIAAKTALLRDALGLWRGPALEDFAYEPFAQGAIADLEELRLTAHEERVEGDLALGRHAELVAELEGLVTEYPLRERLRGQLMLALYRCGRQAEALGVYREVRQLLVDELGIEPAPALRRLEEAVLNQDPAMEAPRAARSRDPSEPAPADPLLAAARKTITVVFADLSQSLSARDGERADPEAAGQAVRRAYQGAREVLERHGGTVEGLIGDVVVTVFGRPRAHEDDAVRAVRAAVELRRDLVALNAQTDRDQGVRLAARFGIDTGEAVVGDPTVGPTASSGSPVAVAARLQQTAGAGEILASEATRRLLGEAALLEAVAEIGVGEARPLAAWKVLDTVRAARSVAPRVDRPMLGRDGELSRLQAAFRRATADGLAVRVTVIAEAGIGKSRLALEFAGRVRARADVLTGHCPSYGEGITFWPLREVVLQAAGGKDRDALLASLAPAEDAAWIAEQVAGAVGLSRMPGRSDKLFPAFRRFFETRAQKRPQVVVFEDVHWAQPTLLDLLEYLVESIRGPVVVLCLARPEFLDERPAWGEFSDRAQALFLGPLGDDEVAQLIATRPPGRMLTPETARRVVAMAQGNPLFAEQILAALHDEHQLVIPPTVQALVVARLDRLGPAERDLIRCASVLGQQFTVPALLALLPTQARREAPRHLKTLEQRELLTTGGRASSGATGLGFRHVLIQLGAYATLTKDARATLHERAASWLETATDEEPAQFDALIGYHLERAHGYRRELGALDAHGHTLAVPAGERLASAGGRAFAHFDAVAAENLLSRAQSLLPADHPQLWQVRRLLAEAYQVMGRHGDADAVLSQLLTATTDGLDAASEHFLRVERARIRLATGPDPTTLHAMREEATQALTVFNAAGDDTGLAQACFLLGLIHLRLGQPTATEQLARQGLAHADRSGSAREQLGARWHVSLSLEPGPRPVEDCIRVCEELRWWRGTEHPGVLSDLAYLRAMVGELNEARRLIAEARRLLVERIRARRPAAQVLRRGAEVEVLAGDLAAAEREFEKSLDANAAMQERDPLSQTAALLSRLLSRQGRGSEAARLADLSKDKAPAESVAAQALWRAAAARVVVARGEAREAVALGRKALELVSGDMLNLRADLCVDLAEVLAAIGRQDQERTLLAEAIDLYTRKGNVVGARRAARPQARPPG